jgi:hypothetical protein
VRVTGGTALADFRDFRRLLPNATSSYGSTALLAELDATLKQFPTVQRTLYAFNGNVPAFYEWLQLEAPFAPTGSWRAIPTAPIAGRDGPAAVWTGRQLLVWGGHGRIPNQGLRPLTDGAAYDPASDRWRVLPPAPIATRVDHAAVWTGREMLIWGGRDARRSFADGAAYNPRTNRWRPTAGRAAAAVAAATWTGTPDAGLGRLGGRPHWRRPVRPDRGPLAPNRPRAGSGRQPLRTRVDWQPADRLERRGAEPWHRLHPGDQPLVDPATGPASQG